jgi:hypothetical protein
MRKIKAVILFLFLAIMLQLPHQLKAQEFLDGVCKVEDGRLIFRIDLNWSREQIKKVSGLFDLDTMLLSKILSGEADSILLAQGWQWKKINNRTAELSKNLIPVSPPNLEKDVAIAPPRLFLMDDNWLHINGLPEPEQSTYGVNNFTRQDVFSYSDSLARFSFPGYQDAREVYISGTFNNWSTMDTPMNRTDDGWSVVIPLKPGKYTYKFIVDGRWTLDPNNKLKENKPGKLQNSVVHCYNYRFVLKGNLNARQVDLAGSFNGFNPGELRMLKMAEGWELPMFLKPGTHAYKFVVDGNWITDPANPVVRPDGRGNFNSFMGIGDTTWFRLNGYKQVNRMILSGTFNGWNTAELNMEKTDFGWELPYIIAPGNYEYKYIADGKWMTDTANPFSNGEGQWANSILVIKPNHTFILDGFPNARKVIVAGTFNGWNESAHRMVQINNRWQLPLYLNPGKHTYKLIVDGKWMLDPGNDLWEENEHGTGNSVLWINQ